MIDQERIQGNERLTKVETEVAGIREEMAGMWRAQTATKDAVDKLAAVISDSNKTDWMTFATVAGLVLTLVGCLWAAAIHPISDNVDRAAQAADKLATAVLVQNDKVSEAHADIRDLKLLAELEQKEIAKLTDEGSPVTITKLALLANEFEDLKEKTDHMNTTGTIDSDKRLSILEAQLKTGALKP